jgi:hypothetical protein
VADNYTGGDPSSAEALNFLWEGLREAKRRFQSGQDAGRDGAIHALETVVKFLALFGPVHREALHAPLARLFDDLMSLGDGKASAMLTPTKKRGRARASGAYDALKGIAVFTVRCLAATGVGLPDAREMVAARLADVGVRPARKGSGEGSGRFSERTLRKWQYDIGFNTTATDTLKLAESEHLAEVLSALGLSVLPAGSTADDLLLQRYPAAELQRAYLTRLTLYIADTRSQETT